jgi:photosystem II stability/assembly factor-like uncharacterized protein
MGGTAAHGGGAGMTGTAGGAGATVSSSDGGAEAQARPPHVVADCGHLPAPGTWEEITPPNFKALAFVIDPSNQAIVYLGGNHTGLAKTTDCGSTWTKIRMGSLSESDNGLQGTMVIDPVDPKIIYTDARYGASGIWKTTDGGVSWIALFSRDVAKNFVNNGMSESIAIDPTDHTHLLVSPHFTCENGHSANCIMETTDSGATWRVIENTPGSSEFSGLAMLDRKTWLEAQPFTGIQRTSDGGKTWTLVHPGHSYSTLLTGPDGTLYMSGYADNVLKSTDGISWTTVMGSPRAVAMAASSTALYTAPDTFSQSPLATAKFSDLKTWTSIPSPNSGEGVWMLQFDSDHKILYSTGFNLGLVWRIVMP